MRDLGALAELAQGYHIVLAAAERRPVAARVLQQLVGLRQPKRPRAALEAVVEDDGGDLPALAAAGAVAQHPAAPEAHRRRELFDAVRRIVAGWATVAGIGVRGFSVPVIGALDRLPVVRDTVEGIEAAAMGLTGEDHAFELGVGKLSLGSDALRQHRAVIRRGMGHRRHGGGLHQRCRMLYRAFDAHGVGRPGIVGAGVRFAAIVSNCIRFAVRTDSGVLVEKLGDGSPSLLAGRLGRGLRRGLAAALGRRRPRCGLVPEQIGYGPGCNLHGKARWNLGGDGGEQPGGIGNARL